MNVTDYRDQLTAALTTTNLTEQLWALATSPATDDHFPELAALAMPDGHGRHKDVLDHSIRVTAKTAPRLVVRLAALCHDLGKPATRRFHNDGTVTFYGHEDVGANLTAARLTKLGYDRGVATDVATIVRMSGRFKDSSDWTDAAVRRFVRDAGHTLTGLLNLSEVDVTSKHQWKHDAQARQVAALRTRIREVEQADARAAERPDLNGQEIMDLLGLDPGPHVGRALAMLLNAKRNNGGPLDREHAIRLLTRWWGTQQAA